MIQGTEDKKQLVYIQRGKKKKKENNYNSVLPGVDRFDRTLCLSSRPEAWSLLLLRFSVNFFYRNDEFYLRIFGIDINLKTQKKKKKKDDLFSRLVSLFVPL